MFHKTCFGDGVGGLTSLRSSVLLTVKRNCKVHGNETFIASCNRGGDLDTAACRLAIRTCLLGPFDLAFEFPYYR